MRSVKSIRAHDDIASDPFQEGAGALLRARYQILGGIFEFATESPELMQIVRWAYGGLPRHRLAPPPRIAVRLVLGSRGKSRRRARSDLRGDWSEPGALAMRSAPGLLCGAGEGTTAVVMSPGQRAGLIIVARDLLRFPYHVRYELIEFAVFTLAARVQGLMPLHAACVGRGGYGVLLIGQSGAGKSTAMLHCALDGLDIVSEDSLFVDPRSLLATGVANFLHMRSESLCFLSGADARLIRNAPVIRRRSGVRKFEVDLRRKGFRLAPRPLEIAAMVALCDRPADGENLLKPLTQSEALARLRASQPYAAGQPGWPSFVARMCDVRAFELRRATHPSESVAAIRALLAGPGRQDRRRGKVQPD